MSDQGSHTPLPRRLLSGNDSGAWDVFDRFFEKLRRLVEQRMSRRLKRHEDSEDIVMSAFESFFRGVDEQRFRIDDSGALWMLLRTITLHKLFTHEDAAKAKKRGGDNHQEYRDMAGLAGRDPTPSDAAIVLDLVEEVLGGLEPAYGEVLRLRLTGCTEHEIAKEMGCGREAVRYKLRRVRERLEHVLNRDSSD